MFFVNLHLDLIAWALGGGLVGFLVGYVKGRVRR
jgi:hypothetical protein